jgi:hypothetical protein
MGLVVCTSADRVTSLPLRSDILSDDVDDLRGQVVERKGLRVDD